MSYLIKEIGFTKGNFAIIKRRILNEGINISNITIEDDCVIKIKAEVHGNKITLNKDELNLLIFFGKQVTV